MRAELHYLSENMSKKQHKKNQQRENDCLHLTASLVKDMLFARQVLLNCYSRTSSLLC